MNKEEEEEEESSEEEEEELTTEELGKHQLVRAKCYRYLSSFRGILLWYYIMTCCVNS